MNQKMNEVQSPLVPLDQNPPAIDMQATAVPESASVPLIGEATIIPDAAQADAAGGSKGAPRFEMLVYAGQAIRPMLKPPLPHPIVVDLAGMDLAKQSRPALKDHDEKLLVGHTEAIRTDGQQLYAAGVVSGTGPAAQEVLGAASNGFKWPVSMGTGLENIEFVRVGASAKANGQTFNGPIFIARKSSLREISFLTIAADDNAVATIAATHAAERKAMSFHQWLAAMGLSQDALTDEQKTKLQAKYDLEQSMSANAGGTAGTVTTGAATATATATTPQRQSLDQILDAERKKDDRRKQIVDLTAKALQDNPGQLQIIEAMSRQALEGEWESQRYELELLRATRPQGPAIHARARAEDRLDGGVIEAALCLAGGMDKPEESFSEQTLEAADKRWKHGLGLGELLMLFARRNGHDALGTRNIGPLLRAAFSEGDSVMLRASGISTLSLPGILSNVANKFLKLGFDSVESTWRAIAAIRPVRDFKQVSSYSLTGDFQYVELPPGGALEHATVGEETYTNQAKTYGRMFGIDRRDIINDDLGALTAVPRRLGRGGALKFNEVFWTAFLDNSTFFTTARANFFEGVTPGTNDTRLNIEGLTSAETAFFDQTDPNGKPLGVMPKVLLVPNALNASAAALMNSTELRDTTSSTKYPVSNPHAGKFSTVRSSYLSSSALTGYSTTAWYLLADPNDMAVIEAAFLNGVESPTVESADADFNQLGIQMRGYHDFGVSKQEYRGGVKMKGAA